MSLCVGLRPHSLKKAFNVFFLRRPSTATERKARSYSETRLLHHPLGQCRINATERKTYSPSLSLSLSLFDILFIMLSTHFSYDKNCYSHTYARTHARTISPPHTHARAVIHIVIHYYVTHSCADININYSSHDVHAFEHVVQDTATTRCGVHRSTYSLSCRGSGSPGRRRTERTAV